MSVFFQASTFLQFERDGDGAISLPLFVQYMSQHANALQLVRRRAPPGRGEGQGEEARYPIAFASRQQLELRHTRRGPGAGPSAAATSSPATPTVSPAAERLSCRPLPPLFSRTLLPPARPAVLL